MRRSPVPPAFTAARLALPAMATVLAADAAHAAASGGLNIFPNVTLLPIMIVLFVAMIYPVSKLLIDPMLRVLDERTERIAGRRDRSAELEGEADVVQGRYEEAVEGARGLALEARREVLDEARKAQTQTTTAARAAAESEVTAAREQIGSDLESVRTDLAGQAEALARQAASQVLGRPLG